MQRLRFTPVPFTTARASIVGALVCAALVGGCKDANEPVAPRSALAPTSQPVFTVGSGTTSTLLGRANFNDPAHGMLRVARVTGNWRMELNATPNFDLAVQNIAFQPGGQSGWHSHPGPVFIQVVSGTMTFYHSADPNCTPVVRTAGQGYLDYGDHAHIARNESNSIAHNVVTYFAPAGAALRIDQPKPGNCPF